MRMFFFLIVNTGKVYILGVVGGTRPVMGSSAFPQAAAVTLDPCRIPLPLRCGRRNQRRSQSGVKAGGTVLRLSGKKVQIPKCLIWIK